MGLLFVAWVGQAAPERERVGRNLHGHHPHHGDVWGASSHLGKQSPDGHSFN